MNITQPIAYLDEETTGTSVVNDRICSIAVNIVYPDGTRKHNYKVINPTIPIPAEATAVHGITEEMVKDAPQFIQIAKSLHSLIKDCVIIGYNSNDFDVVILAEEFARAGIVWPEPNQLFIDCFNIFRKKEGRGLGDALMFYCKEEMFDAHNAAADIEATEKVLLGQLEMYSDLKEMSLEELATFSKYKDNYDLAGKFIKDPEGNVLFSFGKHTGKKAIDVFRDDSYYYTWMCKNEFTKETLRIAKELYEFVNPPKK